MLRKLKYKGKHNAELAIWVYHHKQEKINQNKNFKCAKAAVSWVKRHQSCWYEGQCSISWYNNVLRRTKEDPVYFARILADRHAEISSLFLMRQIRLSKDRFSICNAKWLVYIELAFLSVFGRSNFLSSKYRIFLWIVLAEATSNLRILLQYLPRYTNHTALGIVWSRKSNFAVFESYILLFYQIFSSQIVSKMRKACRRTKGNLLALLRESPQVFGIARLSEVTTIQISH